jgi:ribulose 1,5-bisphosphate synthetase/thiazole synthase
VIFRDAGVEWDTIVLGSGISGLTAAAAIDRSLLRRLGG